MSDLVMLSVTGEESWDLVGSDYFGKFELDYTTRTYNLIVNKRYLGHRFYAKCEELIEGLGISALVIMRPC